MSVTTQIVVKSIPALALFDALPRHVERSAVWALNKTSTWARTESRRQMLGQVAFPPSYLGPSQGRLKTRKARMGHLEAAVTGRTRATSLARFTRQKVQAKGVRSRRKGITVTVRPGSARFMKGAFLIRLRSGNDGSLNNIGLAVRSDGPPPNAYKPTKIGKNLWLLYGPSVEQVLDSHRNQGGVFTDISPETGDRLSAEFLRLIAAEIARA